MASLKQQLAKIALRSLKLSNGKTLADNMVIEAKRLRDCIQFYIDAYYDSYEPVIYERTYGYKKSLKAEDIADIRIVGDTIRIGVKFDRAYATHENLESVYKQDGYGDGRWIPIKDRHDTFVPRMLEEGWSAPRLASMMGRNIYRLTYFEGIHAVERGIEDFNKTNKLGIKIDADDFYKGKAY